jgi:hypothetical protein
MNASFTHSNINHGLCHHTDDVTRMLASTGAIVRVKAPSSWNSSAETEHHAIRKRQRVPAFQHPPTAFSVWTAFTVAMVRRSGQPRGIPLATRLLASMGPNGILECRFRSKTRTLPLSSTNDSAAAFSVLKEFRLKLSNKVDN